MWQEMDVQMHCGFKNQQTSCKPVHINSVIEMDMA